MKYTIEELTVQAGTLMRTHALFYYAVSKILTEEKGFQGQQAVRHWIRIQGNWRGEEMKKAHTALGMPIDVEHIQRFWDNALSDFWYRKEGKYTTYDVAMQVRSCAYADVWQERNWWTWGHVYCDEIHQHILETYNPDGVVVIPECLMKGDETCNFRWILPPSAQLKFEDVNPDYEGQDHRKDYLADTPEEAQRKNIQRGTRILGMQIYMLKKTLDEYFEDDSLELYERIVTLLADERAKDFIKSSLSSRHEILSYVKENFDLPFVAFEPVFLEEEEELRVCFQENPLEEGLSYFHMENEAAAFMKQQCERMSEFAEMQVRLCYRQELGEKGELIITKV